LREISIWFDLILFTSFYKIFFNQLSYTWTYCLTRTRARVRPIFPLMMIIAVCLMACNVRGYKSWLQFGLFWNSAPDWKWFGLLWMLKKKNIYFKACFGEIWAKLSILKLKLGILPLKKNLRRKSGLYLALFHLWGFGLFWNCLWPNLAFLIFLDLATLERTTFRIRTFLPTKCVEFDNDYVLTLWYDDVN